MALHALLGPTNTGKTWVALEELKNVVDAGGTGVIGFPLRLLAREGYDKLVLALGKDRVALVTGEEKIVPPGARAFACTVEAMPREVSSSVMARGRPFDFVAIDEIQLCADRERGHIFTERLLHQRGTSTTMVLGQDTIAPILRQLFSDIEIRSRPRLSTLSYAGESKIARLPKRSAVVCFSVKDVYALAEEVRHHHGGAAVVTGSLSPATRNAQVRLFQDGDVDVLVATDAIGMGLNLDIDHVAFAALRKFDGDDVRELTESELAQIAGRAGRHLKNGTFGTVATTAKGSVPPLPGDVIHRLERHQFQPLSALSWRNSDLDFTSLPALHASLRAPPIGRDADLFAFGRPASDLLALERLMHEETVRETVRSDDDVEAFFACCQIPDFEKLSPDDHASTILEVWSMIHRNRGAVDDDWLARRLKNIRDVSGDVETLVARLARVRTLTYVAHKPGWTLDRDHWESETRAAEDALSDALHEALRHRFVDRLARVVVKGDVKADVDVDGAVSVSGEVIGRLDGLLFKPSGNADSGGTDNRGRRALQTSAATKGLQSAVAERISALLAADDSAFDVDAATLRVSWGSEPIGRLVRGRSRLWPRATALPGAYDAAVRGQLDEKLTSAVHAWVQRSLPATVALEKAKDTTAPLARAWAFAIVQGLGVCPRDEVQEEAGLPDDDARRALRRHRVRLGFKDAFVDDAFKDKAIRARAVLTSLWHQPDEAPPPMPPPGASSFVVGDRPRGFVEACGFHVFDVGSTEDAEAHARAFRADLIDDVAIAIKGFAPPFSSPAVGCEKLGCSHEALVPVLGFLGYSRDVDGRFGRGLKRRRAG